MKQVGQLLREIIPVIVGILAALVINNWNEDRKDKKYLDQIYASIEEELKASNEDIETNIPRQQKLIDSLDAYLEDETISIFDIIVKVGGIGVPTIKNNSWRAIANSKIQLIEFEKLSILSDIDDFREGLEFKQEKILDLVYANLKRTNQEQKEVLKILIADMIYTERELQQSIEKLVE
ncbi:MAG: hypothetical protein AAFW73_23425 [Bacteroidota bacterium]